MLRVQRAPDLGIPEVKPAIESIRGHLVQKVSPKTRHSLLQGLPKDEKPSSLVPDVAYLSYERMPPEGELREKPTIEPDVAVEIVSPEDKKPLPFIEQQVATCATYPDLRIDTVKLFERL
jgi:hypothetical protein